MEFERRYSGARVDIVAGMLVFGADAVIVSEVVVRDYDLRLLVKCSWESG